MLTGYNLFGVGLYDSYTDVMREEYGLGEDSGRFSEWKRVLAPRTLADWKPAALYQAGAKVITLDEPIGKNFGFPAPIYIPEVSGTPATVSVGTRVQKRIFFLVSFLFLFVSYLNLNFFVIVDCFGS